MKKFIVLLLAVVLSGSFFTSCETVPPGHKGVEVSWGGETNMNQIYNEGLTTGAHWLFDDMIYYDVREKTTVHKFEFNDKNNMSTTVEIALDYKYDPVRVNLLHTQITDVPTKIVKTLQSAGKEVVPQYSAVELNINKRTEAEALLEKIVKEELAEFYLLGIRVQMTDVDIPQKVADIAEQTAIQIGKNELAEKMELEKKNLAKAIVAEAQGNYDAAQLDVQTKELMSRPAVLSLYEAETRRIWAEKGVSPFGSNNVYGSTSILKGYAK